tara:strand:+ start:2446 stop:2697 length:252 start_codon:yes stop_codon:yes gene_type:complete
MDTLKEKKEFEKHTEIKEYKVQAVESVRGSARHSSKFSVEKAIIEDTRKQIDILTKMSDHISDLEIRVAKLESLGGPIPPKGR